MRKLIYYVACTVDRCIARTDGSFDFFLNDGEHFADLIATFPETFPAPAREVLGIQGPNQVFDTVLMGRETYEVGAKVGLTNPYPHLTQYVFSRTIHEQPDTHVHIVADDARTMAATLKQQPGKDIWLCGGGALAAALFDEIDEIILKVNPVLIGTGIPLFAGPIKQTNLALTDSKVYRNGFSLMRYRLQHE